MSKEEARIMFIEAGEIITVLNDENRKRDLQAPGQWEAWGKQQEAINLGLSLRTRLIDAM